MANNLIKGSGCGTREWRETFALTDSSGTNVFSVAHNTGAVTAASLALGTGALTRTGVKRVFTSHAKVGGTAGWTVNAANDVGTLATMAASQTAGTLVVRLDGLKVGDTITAFHLIGQIESAGNTATLDADLRSLTAAAADPTDASIATMTQISATADAAITVANSAKTGLSTVVAADAVYYMLLTGTTAASTDIQLLGVALTVTEA